MDPDPGNQQSPETGPKHEERAMSLGTTLLMALKIAVLFPFVWLVVTLRSMGSPKRKSTSLVRPRKRITSDEKEPANSEEQKTTNS